jgi:hypothetical protein
MNFERESEKERKRRKITYITVTQWWIDEGLFLFVKTLWDFLGPK